MKKEKYQPFIFEEELHKVKSEYHGEEGLEKIRELKDFWKKQKLQLIDLEQKVYQDIQEKQANFSPVDFLKENYGLIKEGVFSPQIVKTIEKGLKICKKRIDKIEMLKQECSDDSGTLNDKCLFEKVFSIKPQGDVKVIIRPLGIYFKTNSPEDFALISTGKNISKKSLTLNDLDSSKYCSGMKLNDSVYPELKNSIMIESPDHFLDDSFLNSILKHEEVHSLNSIFFNIHPSDSNFSIKIFNHIADLLKEGLSEEMEMFALDFKKNSKIEEMVKDEILAHFSDKSISSQEVSKNLLGGGTIYGYGFNYNRSETDGEFMHYDYFRIVQDGIVAFRLLLESGYSNEEARNILVYEPLKNWPKVSERMIGKVLSAAEKKEIIDKSIDKEVIQLSDEAKEDLYI